MPLMIRSLRPSPCVRSAGYLGSDPRDTRTGVAGVTCPLEVGPAGPLLLLPAQLVQSRLIWHAVANDPYDFLATSAAFRPETIARIRGTPIVPSAGSWRVQSAW